MKAKFDLKRLLDVKWVLALYLLLALFAGYQSWVIGPKVLDGKNYTHYNNYLIFKNSYQHLLQGSGLYKPHPDEYFDLYKYSPTFALGFGLFAHIPNLPGLLLWNLLNALLLYAGILALPRIDNRIKAGMLLFMAIELMTSMQNQQSNGMIAGLLILSFACLEKDKTGLAAFLIAITVFIKLFGAVAFLLFIFYSKKPRFVFYAVLWMLLLLLLPLPVTGIDGLIEAYRNWALLLQADHASSAGFSVMGWLNTWFGQYPSKMLMLGIGVLLLLIPLLSYKKYLHFGFRLFYLAYILLWIVIFNHKAESPTFIIAMSGIALWGFYRKPGIRNIILLAFAFVLISLAPTDIFPRSVREDFFKPYVIKAFPAILIWTITGFDLLLKKFETGNRPA